MKVQVLFFGATVDAVGKREIEMPLVENTKAEKIFDEIVGQFPQLKSYSLLFAVNQEYANGGEIIKNGDELAVFTAVSGG
ncbi:molybdopterin converting factor subunit 1 [soil metagenome]